MQKPTLLVIGGIPGSGKTTLGERLAKDLGFVFLNKDSILEMLWESFDWIDHEAHLASFRSATYNFLYEFVGRVTEAGNSVVIESNFNNTDHATDLKELGEKLGLQIVYIHCHTRPEVGFERFIERQQSGKRHRFHTPRNTFEEYVAIFIDGKDVRLQISDLSMEVDTNDFSTFSYPKVLEKILDSLER